MIVITGSVMTNSENRAKIETLCIEHSQRSRGEPGCIAHNVHSDCENPDKLVFVEIWADADAVKTHFKVPESGEFVRQMGELSTERPTIQIYNSEEIPMTALAS